MIDELKSLAIFATVAETGSFSAAGRQLKLATSGISQHVSKLEDRVGVTLLYRSTRSLSLTTDGKKLLKHAKRMMLAAEEGLDTIANVSQEPTGELSLSLPAFMVNSYYDLMIWDFVRRYKSVGITVRYLDQNVDLVGEGVDMALRMGQLLDSNLRCRRLGSFARKIVCAPSYLEQIGKVKNPDDLKKCNFIAIEGLITQLSLVKGKKEALVQTNKGRITVNNFFALRSALRNGLGVQRMPESVVENDLKTGALVQLLPDWTIPDLGIYAVTPGANHRGALSKLLIDHIAQKSI
jgi:DNA-binding transcriptional LysR family regulator